MSYIGDETLFSKFVKVFADEVQVLEDVSWEVRTLRWILNATDEQLDNLGAIVGETRQGRSDADYLIAIIAKIDINASNGEPERLLRAARALTGVDIIHLDEIYPAQVHLTFDTSDTIPTNIIAYLQRVVGAGVELTASQSVVDPFMYTKLDGGGTPVVIPDTTGLGYSEVATPGTGGKYSQVIS